MIYLAEHSQSDIRQYEFAIINRKRLGTLSFDLAYKIELIRKVAAKIPYAKKIYRKLNSLFYR